MDFLTAYFFAVRRRAIPRHAAALEWACLCSFAAAYGGLHNYTLAAPTGSQVYRLVVRAYTFCCGVGHGAYKKLSGHAGQPIGGRFGDRRFYAGHAWLEKSRSY